MAKKPSYDELERRKRELDQAESEHEQAKDAALNSKALYKMAFNSSPSLMSISTLADGRFLEVNEAFTRILGYQQEEILGRTSMELDIYVDEADRASFIEKLKSDGRFNDLELCLRAKSGDEKIVLLGAVAINVDDKKCMLVSAEDITERKQAEEALKKNEERLRLSTEKSGVAVWEYDLIKNQMSRSENHDKLYGLEQQDIWAADTFLNATHQNDREKSNQVIQESINPGGSDQYSFDFRVIWPDKSIHWLSVRAEVAERDAEGFATLIQGCLIDITERKRIENDLRLDESRLEALLKLSQMATSSIKEIADFALEEAIRLTDSDIGYLAFTNADESIMSMYSWSQKAMDICAIEEKQIDYNVEETGLWGEAVRQRKAIITNDYEGQGPGKKGYPKGHISILRHMNTPVFEGEHIVAVAGVGNKKEDYDDSDLRQLRLMMQGMWRLIQRKKADEEKHKLEERLQQAQKMEAIGTLAGGVAHDFNNILAAILGYAEMAREDSPPESIVARDLDKVLEGGRRAKDLVHQILAFSRQTEMERIPLQPGSVVKEALKMLRPSLPMTIEINQDINPATGLILADPTQIHQILMNLCTNAFHAMEESGGKLGISLKEVILSTEDLVHEPGVKAGTFIQLSIRDSGPGIPLEIKKKIFEPYFTTKEPGKGTGMGLAIVHGIVKNYGGFISLYSEPGEGSDFQVFIPAIEKEPLPEIEDVKPVSVGGERILFIDDEEILAEMGKSMLERLGYHVTVRNNSLEALKTFKNQPNLFDLVITDQTMPGMTGADIARRMIQIKPDIPIILCTGYSTVISEEKAKSIGIKEFALKPLSKKDIAVLIRKVLDNP